MYSESKGQEPLLYMCGHFNGQEPLKIIYGKYI